MKKDAWGFKIRTFGCKTNSADAEKIAAGFYGDGGLPDGENPSLCVVNACCVTERAENKALKAALDYQKRYPSSEVVLSGCVTDSLREAALKSGIGVKRKFSHKPGASPHLSNQLQRYLLKVQNGCDNFCSYCIVPVLRGAAVSRSRKSVMRELAGLESAGVFPGEIVLTGTNISLYRDAGGDIVDLIRAIGEKYSSRIRLSSLEPPFEKDFVKRLAESGNVCPHFPVPLQNGSDRILKQMGRKYTVSGFMELVAEIRKYFDEPAVTTDIIYGFPGETEIDFSQTLSLIEEAGFSKTHVFPFSSRRGTLAFLRQSLPPAVMKERKKRIMAVSEKAAGKYRKKFIGKNLEVVAETKRGESFYGTSGNYLKVGFGAGNIGVRSGDIVRVAVDGEAGAAMNGSAGEILWKTQLSR
ncbi:MAG: radical SAM protein [Elusimicrobiota bacterium]|nr:radical SAM protein [Elusimicrobiota bacterium]